MNRYETTREYIVEKMKGLRPTLYYHGLHHVLDVLQAAEMIGRGEQLSDRDMELLRVAVLFHDAGFLYDSVEHEKRGCAMARESLPGFGYSAEEIELICGMIMATVYPHHPNNHLEEIICDADLDYLGREDFYPISQTLFRELAHYHVVEDENDWNRMQVKFLTGHRYFTKTSKELRDARKAEHLESVKKALQV